VAGGQQQAQFPAGALLRPVSACYYCRKLNETQSINSNSVDGIFYHY
jgi:hypothetical protein